MKLNVFVSNFLRNFPSLHSAIKQFYTKRLLMKPPATHPAGFQLLGSAAMQNGTFEPDETKQISDLLQSCDILVNVGANIGYYVCIARALGKSVVAVEPLDRNIQLLKQNIANNNWLDVEVLPIGLGDRESLQKIYGGGTAASLVPGWAGANRETYELVPVSTLDNVLSDRFANRQILILIDVEGFELNVIKGAIRQLGRHPRPIWFIEVCIDEHQPAGTDLNPDLEEVFELFWKHGYSAQKAGCETGIVSREDLKAWAKGQLLPKTHNFIFRTENTY
ncbi:MAG: FkbM family methyltransferase [Planctomycetaceae bacterium]